MAKRQIRVREPLEDLRAGMDDVALMAKYQLSAKGLQSLFSKLVIAGLTNLEELNQRVPGFMSADDLSEQFDDSGKGLKWELRKRKVKEKPRPAIKAREMVDDIKEGMTDGELMDEYALSAEALEYVFGRLVDAGLVTREEIDERNNPFDSTVDLRDVINSMDLDELDDTTGVAGGDRQCPECGSVVGDHFNTCPDCGEPIPGSSEADEPEEIAEPPVEPAQQVRIEEPPQMPPQKSKRKINLKKLAADIKAGMVDNDLLKKYELTHADLDVLFRQLLDGKLVTKGELYGRASLFPQTVAFSVDEIAHESAHYLAFPLPVYSETEPEVIGRVRELSEFEMGVVGLNAAQDRTYRLVILPEKFVKMKPLKLNAICTWVRSDKGGQYAGFELSDAGEDIRRQIRRLVEMLTFGAPESE